MSLTLVPPRQGRSRYWRIRGTVRRVYIDETTGVESRELAEAIRIKREGQILDESIFGPRASRRFSEAAVSYIETVRPDRTQTQAIIGHARQDGTISRCLIDDFGSMLVNDIDQASVDKVMRERFGRAAPATAQRHLLTPLIAVLTFAAERKWCDRPHLWRPPTTKGRTRWATYDEADRLLEACSSHLRPLVAFLILTGARIGEALRLQWKDVSLADRWCVFRDTKNGEDRGIPLHYAIVAILANLPGAGRSGSVFLSNFGRPYADREGGGHIKTAWRGTLRRAGITDLRPHDLRHTCSTWLTMAGVHEQVRDEVLGHASSDMGRRYSHIPRASLLDAIDRLPTLEGGKIRARLPARRKREHLRPCSVYVLAAGRRLKVGIAVDVKKRLDGIQVGSPIEISLQHHRLVPIAHARSIEAAVHNELSDYRVRGEWFEAPLPLVIEAIERIADAHGRATGKVYQRAITVEMETDDQKTGTESA